ncbi:hypothetical protein BAUCODRAFT_37513 [Baudoinia panamericana UAMH 10762]|uniref:Uncharacterized protein n=1 Tax=Baudoinia panamericana (strain UAMH 10762) TaxID=717646 RepID=M2N126_BAUPA|nr:uncharacterized protein BAUCODRAFT_37513 [Baudoinia panamericana UAMH 10762]EMC92619.1 hypothetical protein BAUCODRAFT_37513 [Baudoinia panamericana UAMH 10762]
MLDAFDIVKLDSARFIQRLAFAVAAPKNAEMSTPTGDGEDVTAENTAFASLCICLFVRSKPRALLTTGERVGLWPGRDFRPCHQSVNQTIQAMIASINLVVGPWLGSLHVLVQALVSGSNLTTRISS